MSNILSKTILDQYTRVQAAGDSGHEVLGEAKGEIMDVATQESIREIIGLTGRHLIPSSRRGPISADFTAQRLAEAVGRVRDSGLFVPDQGYLGLIVPEDEIVMGVHASGSLAHDYIEGIMSRDPIQQACGPDFLYPAMMWAKALYSEAYRNRPESQRDLPVHVWLAELVDEGLFQGSALTENGLIGATGWMPSRDVQAELGEDQKRSDHISSEEVPEFRASGLMDQFALRVVTSNRVITAEEVVSLANEILDHGGCLN